MKTLDQVKLDYAIEHGYLTFEDFTYSCTTTYGGLDKILECLDNVAKIYAIEALEEARLKKLTTHIENNGSLEQLLRIFE